MRLFFLCLVMIHSMACSITVTSCNDGSGTQCTITQFFNIEAIIRINDSSDAIVISTESDEEFTIKASIKGSQKDLQGATYQWQSAKPNTSLNTPLVFTNIPGATTIEYKSIFTVPNLILPTSTEINGTVYRLALIKDKSVITSNQVLVIINTDQFSVGSIVSNSNEFQERVPATFQLGDFTWNPKPANPTIEYQWQKAFPNDPIFFTDIPQAISSQYITPADAKAQTSYRCRIKVTANGVSSVYITEEYIY